MHVNTVTVIGVTGTMGANIAGIFASFGNAKVYCLGRDIEKVKKTIPRIIKPVKADSIMGNLIPADYSMLEQCVSKSDIVFETATEDISLKIEIADTVSKYLPAHAISCTGSSGLSIKTIAECYPEELRKQFFGVHMFNPPYSMTLCELIPTIYSNNSLLADLKEYLEKILLRTVVVVKDSPAFLGNRIGFQFINESLQFAERYKNNGGVDYIDAIIGPFTGRSMPPLVTADFVGLDVHKAIVDNLYANTKDYASKTFIFPRYAQQLVDEAKLGRKSGQGLYKTVKYENGSKRIMVFDLISGQYRDKIEYVFPFSEKMNEYISNGDYDKAFQRLVADHSQEAHICLSFLLKYLVYSLYTTEEVGYTIEAADDVMATGFNWCPPLAMYQVLSKVANVKQLIIERIGNEVDVDLDHLLANVQLSKYDYRIFLKSDR